MVDRKGGPSPSDEAELSRDRCPSCNGPLRFPNNRREGLCAACGIFVEILEPLASEAPDDTRGEDDVTTRRELAEFDLQFEQVPEDLDAQLESVIDQVLEPPEAPQAEGAEPAEEAISGEGLVIEEPVEEESPASESGLVLVEEVPEAPFFMVEPSETPAIAPAAVSRASAASAAKAVKVAPLRHRILFHLGTALVVFGGSGLALGSLLHDVFRMPVVGTAYEAFGPVNVAAAFVGSIALLAGAAAMAVAARIGASRRRRAAGA